MVTALEKLRTSALNKLVSKNFQDYDALEMTNGVTCSNLKAPWHTTFDTICVFVSGRLSGPWLIIAHINHSRHKRQTLLLSIRWVKCAYKNLKIMFSEANELRPHSLQLDNCYTLDFILWTSQSINISFEVLLWEMRKPLKSLF